MQLYGEGKLQGITVNAIPKSERPAALDGTLVGDVGFDPLGFSSLIDLRWLREAEIKHGRVCMLAATGLIVQDVYQFPGVTRTFGDAKVTALHDAAVKQGAMQQLLIWLGLLEIFGAVAIIQMLQGSDRQPGDFGFDPLGLVSFLLPNHFVAFSISLLLTYLFHYCQISCCMDPRFGLYFLIGMPLFPRPRIRPPSPAAS
jgi:hypothetical protein